MMPAAEEWDPLAEPVPGEPEPEQEQEPPDRGDLTGPLTDAAEPRLALAPRRIALFVIIGFAIVVGLYTGLSALAGLRATLDRISEADPVWIAVALVVNILSFGSYIGLFRGVMGKVSEIPGVSSRITWKASYEVTLAGLAATRLFSAGGAGGIALSYWALRRAGMPRRETARRMFAFLVLLYTVYMLAVVVCGVLLRAGVFAGSRPVGMTLIPAALAAVGLVTMLLVSLIPQDFERLIGDWARGHRRAHWARRLATGPVTLAAGARTAIGIMRRPSQGFLALSSAIGFWAANIGVLWACFHAFGHPLPTAVLIQGFFVGMTANLIPSPGGIGAVDAGMIGAFVGFGVPAATVVAAVLTYRAIAFFLPIPPGVVAYLQLRRRVAGWEVQGPAPVSLGGAGDA